MKSLRSRLIFSHLLPLLIVIPLVAVALAYLLETQVLLGEMSDGLTEQANLIAEAVNVQPELLSDEAQARTFVQRVGVLVDGGVLLLRPSGEMLAASGSADDQSPDLTELQNAIENGESVVISYGLFEQTGRVFVPVRDVNQQLLGIVGVSYKLEGVATQFGRLRGWLILILLLELVVGAAIGFVLASRLERPITRSAAAVVDIAEGYEIGTLPLQGPREIQELASSVNVLAERLRLLEDIRRRSLANIVHEIGRPLGAVRAAIHVLQQSPGDDPEVRAELLTGIVGELEWVQPLLDDLAQLHGQVEGSVVLNRAPVDLSEWLPPVLLPWRAAAQQKGLVWRAEIPSSLPVFDLDANRMAQAIGNLLSNAIKYTPEGGQVTVEAVNTAEEIRIQVADTGPGIQPEEQQRVFEPFYRSQQQKRFPQGLGVGLTLARDIVRAHGGELELQSTPGDGSTFAIRLPRSTQAIDH
ncbi:MAG: sensor histidine kinase [Caldilineales bacterium]|nr:sensor histidine kinase [Caldilineales bacterium]